MWAARKGELEIVRLLRSKGATIDARDAKGETALMKACRGKRWTMARALLDLGADLNLRDGEGRTALEIAASLGHKIERPSAKECPVGGLRSSP